MWSVARDDFAWYIAFIAGDWFDIEEVHVYLADELMRVVRGETDRLFINEPPRAGKSQMVSRFLPSFWFGHHPKSQFMGVTHSTGLSDEFSEEVQSYMMQDDYQGIFPGVKVRGHNGGAKRRWRTSMGGYYRSTSVNTKMAGKGFNLGVVDDPISEQEARSPLQVVKVNNWYGSGFYTRRQPEQNAIVVTMTRWEYMDLQGFLLNESHEGRGDTWRIVRVPAILDDETAAILNSYAEKTQRIRQYLEDKRAIQQNRPARRVKLRHYEAGDSFSPRRWKLTELMRSKANMSNADWNALYLQSPLSSDGGIWKRHWWKWWLKEDKQGEPLLPEIIYVIQSYDTAFKEGQENDYTVRTTWGIFERECEDGITRYNLILLEMLRERIGFPELRENARDAYREYDPDEVIIEDAGSGQSLIQELRLAKIPVRPIKPRSKLARAHATSVVPEKGCVWLPKREFSNVFVKECSEFPKSEHDDIVDSAGMAFERVRRKFWLQLPDEEDDDEEAKIRAAQPAKRGIYG